MSGIRPSEFSVIVPSYDRARLLGDAIASVQEKTFGDFECVVVDGPRDPRIRLIRREVNGGCSAARNTGLRAAALAAVVLCAVAWWASASRG